MTCVGQFPYFSYPQLLTYKCTPFGKFHIYFFSIMQPHYTVVKFT